MHSTAQQKLKQSSFYYHKRGYICGWNCTLFEDLQADGDAILKLSADADAVTDTESLTYMLHNIHFLSASLYVSKRGAY